MKNLMKWKKNENLILNSLPFRGTRFIVGISLVKWMALMSESENEIIKLMGRLYMTGVSNTRPAGRVWPPTCVCAAMRILKDEKNCNFFVKFRLFWEIFKLFVALRSFFPLNCGPRSIISLECGPPINLSLIPLGYDVT